MVLWSPEKVDVYRLFALVHLGLEFPVLLMKKKEMLQRFFHVLFCETLPPESQPITSFCSTAKDGGRPTSALVLLENKWTRKTPRGRRGQQDDRRDVYSTPPSHDAPPLHSDNVLLFLTLTTDFIKLEIHLESTNLT